MTGFICKNGKSLRNGVTTGACAAAASKAAVIMLISGESVQTVSIKTRTGAELIIPVSRLEKHNDFVYCSVIKDSGDDPDVTDGIEIAAKVSVTDTGIQIDGGEGIGVVTRPGLKVPVGRPAINPVPQEMIKSEVMEICDQYGYAGGLQIVISAPSGTEITRHTMNERLGIVGGVSILGTTGIVEPMSESGFCDAIKAEIDVLTAESADSLLITPGRYGWDFAESEYGLDMKYAVKCSNYIGETLDYACFVGVRRITIVGHAGKMVKLAAGIMNTHSKIADGRMEIIAAHCGLAGASSEVIYEIMDCATVDAAIKIMKLAGINQVVWESISGRICHYLRERTKNKVFVKFIIFSHEYGVLVDSDTGRSDRHER